MPGQNVVITLSWAGMQVARRCRWYLRAALRRRKRDLLLFPTSAGIATLNVQLVLADPLDSNEQRLEDDLSEAAAQQAAAAAATARLDELVAEGVPEIHEEVVQGLRDWSERVARLAWERSRRHRASRRGDACDCLPAIAPRCSPPSGACSSGLQTSGRTTTRCCARIMSSST